jgi:thymidylate synthase
MSEGFPLITSKKMYFKGIVTELLWFLRGDTNIKYLIDNNCHIWDGDAYKNYCKWFQSQPKDLKEYEGAILPTQEEFISRIKTNDEFAMDWGDLGPIYGAQWRNLNSTKSKQRFFDKPIPYDRFVSNKDGIDQIANSINLLKTDPDSRRNRVNAWNVGELDQMVLPPCHTDFQFFTRVLSSEERKEFAVNKHPLTSPGLMSTDSLNSNNIPTRAISLMFNMRSTDVGLGLSFNLSSYGLLLMMIAKQVNMVPDELIYNGGDVHLYLNHIEPIKEQLTREPYSLPTVKISDRVVNDISEYTLDDIKLEGYQSHPSIKMPLSN